MKKMEIIVLLSTYNGERWIGALLDSLASQTVLPTRLIIRDDGSSDRTIETVRSHDLPFEVDIRLSANIGAAASFMELLLNSSADFVFLCDQDDVWESEKIECAVTLLSQYPLEQPLMYCSRLFIVDEALNSKGLSPICPKIPTLGNALIENIATGCTIALNKKAVQLIRSPRVFGRIIMHDWWLYILISAFGTVIYDYSPHIRYRIHGTNHVGLPTSFLDSLIARFRRLTRENTLLKITQQADLFLETYGSDLSTDRRDLVEFIAKSNNWPARLRVILSRKFYRQRMVDDIMFRLLWLIVPA